MDGMQGRSTEEVHMEEGVESLRIRKQVSEEQDK